MIDDMLAFMGVMVGLVLALAFAVFLCMVLWAWIPGPLSCTALAEGMHVKTEYRFWYGCFVTMPDGRILPESIARDVLKQEYRVDIKQK